MTDLAIAWNNEIGAGDLCIANADLVRDDGIQSAVLISLFTDARVSEDELPPGITWRRGWWGNALEAAGRQYGSKLWLLRRAKQTQQNLTLARDYARQALQWMLDDGAATAIEVTTAYTAQGWLLINANITLPDDTRREFQFSDGGG